MLLYLCEFFRTFYEVKTKLLSPMIIVPKHSINFAVSSRVAEGSNMALVIKVVK